MSRPDLKLLLGRRIVGALLKEGQGPGGQLFLILDDGTYTEVYSDWLGVSIGWPGGAERARAYMASTHHITREAHLPAETRDTSSQPTVASPSTAADEMPRRPGRPTRMPPGMTKEQVLAIWRSDLAPSLKN